VANFSCWADTLLNLTDRFGCQIFSRKIGNQERKSFGHCWNYLFILNPIIGSCKSFPTFSFCFFALSHVHMDRIQLTSDSLNRSNKLSAGLKGPNHFGQKPSNYPSLLYFKENYIKNILGKYVKIFQSLFIYLFLQFTP
jgi:hypothetical protein